MAIVVREAESCRICWADIPEGCQTKMTLGCGHTFDAHCIMGWLNTSETKNCPQCLKVVVDKGSLWVPRSWLSTLSLSRCLLYLFNFMLYSSLSILLIGGEILRNLPVEEVWFSGWLEYFLHTYAQPVLRFCLDFISIVLIYIMTLVKGGPLLPDGLLQLMTENTDRYEQIYAECSRVPNADYYCVEMLFYNNLRAYVILIAVVFTFIRVINH